ncbi:MAG: hypothetical protein INR73_19430 [Williamsia sp.]|nr:hypothetical protein [Williamsia sp.]
MLFEIIDSFKAGTISAETAAQITDVARAIIDSAKVENQFIQLTGTNGSGFIPVIGEQIKDQKQIELAVISK